MTMKERIFSGKLFTDDCEGMPAERTDCKKNMIAFNASSPEDIPGRFAILGRLFGKEVKAWIEPPFYCCYGTHIDIGDGTYINFNCNFVDDGRITIGQKVMFGPAVTIATVGHPINPDMRGYMYTDPVKIGNNCWIGAGADDALRGCGLTTVAAMRPISTAAENGSRLAMRAAWSGFLPR